MRVESDRQGNFRSEAPACTHCGVPLLPEATFCPFCERAVNDEPQGSSQRASVPAHATRVILAAGVVFFALVALISAVAAFVV